MMDIHFEKLYRYPRKEEHCFIGIPVKQGELHNLDQVAVLQNNRPVPLQKKVTSRHQDGSVRFMFLRFMADLPANKGTTLQCDFHSQVLSDYTGIRLNRQEQGITVISENLAFQVENNSSCLFTWLESQGRRYEKEQFKGPFLKVQGKETCAMEIGNWRVEEEGPVCVILKARGRNLGEQQVDFELKLTAFAKKPWVEVSYRLINTTDEPLHVGSLVFSLSLCPGAVVETKLNPMHLEEEEGDSTGCGDILTDNSSNDGPIFHTRGITELEDIQKKAEVSDVRTCVGSSNYKTDFYIGKNGCPVNKVADARLLVEEANEHFGEVFYGTFFADCTDERGGVCATIFQAQQNYPKAVLADGNGIGVMLVPENVDKVVMEPGMSREQKFLLHFHGPQEPLLEIDNRSLIYQMPDRPYVSPAVHRDSGVYLDVFPEKFSPKVEQCLIGRGDCHARCYGMLNFGDAPDPGYTMQGRGHGESVWCNNEYDYPHACALMYVRTGIRRFMDYNIAACSHWMDVDVCHYSTNPLYIGGQWEHTNGHCKNGVMVCSHEWVEGLFDYYHLTGDERGLETALGIGENVRKLLDTPMYAHVGEANARETGWALRTLTALYVETRDEKWLEKCKWILENFKVWEEQYGNWLAPYTDNTVIRVGFMISVAIGSVMRYYREFPDDALKEMMLRAVDDLIENCYMDNGLFYYKELPSLNRLGNNSLLLESLAIAYELTGDAEYLKPGLRTFQNQLETSVSGYVGKKVVEKDAVMVGSGGTKTFAQSFIPLITYYKAVSDNGLIEDQEL